MIAVIVSIFVIYAVFSYLCPTMVDDLMFWCKYLDANGGCPNPSFFGYCTYVKDLWLYENGRLANMLCAPVVLWVPRAVWAILLSAVICMVFLLSARLVNGNWHFSPVSLMCVWIGGILFLPWRDYSSLMLTDYALNYFPSTLLTLGTILAASNTDNHIKYKTSYPAVLLMGVFAGIFHEGFSLPLIAGLTTVAVMRRFRMPRQWWGIYMALIAGCSVCVGSPAIWTRFFETVEEPSAFHLLPYIKSFVKTTPLFFIFVIMSVMALLIPKMRNMSKECLSDKLNQYIVLTAIYGAIMVIALKAPVRATTGLNMLLIIFFLRIIRSAKLPRLRISNLVAVAALMITGLFYAGVLNIQYDIYEENNGIINQLKLIAKNKSIYKDTICRSPWWMLGHPVTGIWYTRMQALYINRIYGRPEDIPPVLPQILRYYDFDKPVSIPGNVGYFQAGDILLMRLDTADVDDMPSGWRFTLADGKEMGSYVTFIPFSVGSEHWIAGFPANSHVKGPFMKIVPSD